MARQLPALLKLPPGAPVYADGASSGGSIALRLPRLAKLDGAIGGKLLGALEGRGESMAAANFEHRVDGGHARVPAAPVVACPADQMLMPC